MPLDAIVDSLEGVPEQYRELYAERDGKYRLDVQGVEFPDEVQGLKSALQKEREAAKEAQARLKAYGEIDPDTVRKLMSEREKQEDELAAKRGEFDKLLAKKEAKHTEALEAERQRVASLEKQVLGLVRDQEARKALEQAGANVDLLLPHVLSRVEVIEQDGARKAVVLGDEGAPRLNDEGNEMSISELVAEMANSERYRAGFPAQVAQGGGAANNGAGRASGGFDPRSATDAEKAAFIAKNGRDAFLKALGVS